MSIPAIEININARRILNITLELGSNIVVSGIITPPHSEVSVDLSYTIPNGTVIERTTTANSTGGYSDTYAPSTAGSWSVSVSWDGDAIHEGASSSSSSFTVEEEPEEPEEPVTGLCIIATATYGSELSPEVQFLRGFRDNTVYSTFAGSSFMKVFNEFYYSFSPNVASAIADNSALRDIMRTVLYPLIGILHVASTAFSVLSFSSELGVVVAGLIARAFSAPDKTIR